MQNTTVKDEEDVESPDRDARLFTEREHTTEIDASGRAVIATPPEASHPFPASSDALDDGAGKIGESDEEEGYKPPSTPPPPPPPPALDGRPRLELRMQPGAFHVTPGLEPQRRRPTDGVPDRQGNGPEQEVSRPTRHPSRDNNGYGAYLVEADLVQEPVYQRTSELFVSTMLVEARPVRRWNWIVFSSFGIIFLVMISLGASLGIIVPNSRGPSVSSSTMPSSRPTPDMPEWLLTFRSSLPSYTIEKLKNESSPQSKAWEWIAAPYRQPANPQRLTQRFALATLYFATSGENLWKSDEGWLKSWKTECRWFGCNCSAIGTITSLELDENGLAGTLPKELTLLQDLETLSVYGNRGLRGTIASEIEALTALHHLDLSTTRISGRLPTEIGLLRSLETLTLGDSRISGTIPSELGHLTSLVELELSLTSVVGPLPRTIGSSRVCSSST